MSYIGSTKIGRLYLGVSEIGKAYLGAALVFQKGAGPTPPSPSRLPAGYTEVQYLENTAAAYIDTGISPACTWSITAQAAAVPATNGILIGTKTSAGHWVGAITNGFWGTGTGYIAGYPNTSETHLTIITNPQTVVFSAGSSATKTVTASANITTSVWLFSASPSASTYYPFRGKIIGDIVGTRSGVEIFRGVPCLNQSNVAGLYDLVSNSFIAPSNGTLIAGPNAN